MSKSQPELKGVYQRNEKRESAGSAIVQIAVALAAALGVLFWYANEVEKQKAVAELKKNAKEAAKADDAPALLAAKKHYEDIPQYGVDLEKDENLIVAMAELTAQLYQAYGMQEMRSEAQRFVSAAKDKDIRKAERYAAEAYLLLGDGDVIGAENVIKQLTDKGIRHAKLLHALSLAKLAQGRAREAQKAAEEGQKLSTTLVRLPIAHGDALVAQGNFGSAGASYKKALVLNGNHVRARTAILLAQAVSGQGAPNLLHKGTANLLQEVQDVHGDKAPPRVKAFILYADGEVFLRENEAQKALEQADAALQTDPKLHEAHSLRGRALARLEKIDESKAAFTAALQAVPTSLPYANAAARVMLRAKQPDDAVGYLEGVSASAPDNGYALVDLALVQARAGKAPEATKTAERAIEKLGNAHELALFAKARALQASNDLEKARETYNEALSARGDQKWPEVFFEMGYVRFKEKAHAEAVALFSEAIKLWEKSGGDVLDIVSAYEAAAAASEAMGGRANLNRGAELRAAAVAKLAVAKPN